jgi:hypothetical protein
MTTQNTFDNPNRLTGKSSALDFFCEYNAANQRAQVGLRTCQGPHETSTLSLS